MISAPQLLAGLKRFAKGFVAGGIAQVVLIVGPGLSFHSLSDVKAVLMTVAFGFVTGGLLALEKMVNWQEPDMPTIDTAPPSDAH